MDINHKLDSMETRARLSTLWIFVLFNVLFRDMHQLFAQGFLEEAMTGTVGGHRMTESFLLLAGFMVQIPIAMVILSRILNDRGNRWANIAAGVLTLAITIGNTATGGPDLDDIFFATIETAALATIVWISWRWTRRVNPRGARPARARAITGATMGVALVGLLAATPAISQKGDFEIGAGAGLTGLDDKLGGDSGLSLDLRAGYFLTDRFEIEIQNARASSILEGSFNAITLNAVYHFERPGRFVPYVLLGAGTVEVELDEFPDERISDDGNALRAAVGGRFKLGAEQRSSIRVELGALNEDSFGDDSTHVSLTCSFGWRFGRK